MSGTNSYDITPGNAPQKKMEDDDRTRLINRNDPIAEEGFYEGIIRPCIAEFVAVTIFVFVGTMSVQNNGAIEIAIAHGFTIALLVAATGAISGGHINPAVTLGVYLAGGIPTIKAILYFISQILGGILGAFLTRGCLSVNEFKKIDGGAQKLGLDSEVGQGLLCEVLLTSILVTVVLLTAVDEGTKIPFCALPIGFTVTADILAGGLISGASMNPARSFGPAVSVSTYTSSVWDYHWIYWVGPALGALLAAIVYRLFLASRNNRRCFGSSSS